MANVNARGLRSTLDRIPSIRHACDLDLLLFFRRHPRALLTSEQLVAYLGYDRERTARSLEGLIAAGLLTRLQSPSHAARLYVLEVGGAGGPLWTLLAIAATRQGRLEVLRHLRSESGPGPSARVARRYAIVPKVA